MWVSGVAARKETEGRTDAILWMPDFCSSSGVVPKAFDIIAHLPKNSRDLI